MSITLLACWSAVNPCAAETWVIVHDPDQPSGQIGLAAQHAASGDTLLIGPGVYFEHISIGEKTLTIIGREGRDATVLDGSQTFDGLGGSVIYGSVACASADLTVIGVTLKSGRGVVSPWHTGRMGGAISWAYRGRLALEECSVVENRLLDAPGDVGGGLGVAFSKAVSVRSCRFSRNQAVADGGAVLFAYGDSLEIEDSEFLLDEEIASSSAFVRAVGLASCVIKSSKFAVTGTLGMPSFGLDLDCSSVELVDNECVDWLGQCATRVRVLGRFKMHDTRSVSIRGNRFWVDPDGLFPILANAVYIEIASGLVSVLDNSFVRSPLGTELGAGSEIQISRNIWYRGGPRIGGLPTGVVSCNDVFPDSLAIDDEAGLEVVDNIRQDPLFCDVRGRDLRIAEESACASGNSPENCDTIGGIGIGCSLTPLGKSGWGSIKGGFRMQ